MLNYPLSVFLDTNIYISCRYDLSQKGVLFLLKNLVEQDKVKLYISNIVVKEIEKHIKQDISSAISNFNKIRKEISKSISPNIVCGTQLSPVFELPDKYSIQETAINNYRQFLQGCNAIHLNNEGIEINEIIDDYFKANPPFENKEAKKNEFPDAFIIAKLKKEFDKDKPLWVISSDKGFKKAFEDEEGFNCFSSIKELLNMINKQDEMYDKVTKHITTTSVINEISDNLIEKIESDNIEIDGMDCDRKGNCEGYEYSYTCITDASIKDIVLSTVDAINNNIIYLTLLCNAKFDASCFYDDYENAIWDSEEKEYLYLGEQQIDEEHETKFECSLEIEVIHEKEGDKFKVRHISYDLELDQYSRIKRSFIECEDPRIAAEAEMMDALEEYYKH